MAPSRPRRNRAARTSHQPSDAATVHILIPATATAAAAPTTKTRASTSAAAASTTASAAVAASASIRRQQPPPPPLPPPLPSMPQLPSQRTSKRPANDGAASGSQPVRRKLKSFSTPTSSPTPKHKPNAKRVAPTTTPTTTMIVTTSAMKTTTAAAANGNGAREERAPMVGDFVEIWWSNDNLYYRGRLVHIFDADATGVTFRIVYDDGEQEDINLEKEQWKYSPPLEATAGDANALDDEEVLDGADSDGRAIVLPLSHIDQGNENKDEFDAPARPSRVSFPPVSPAQPPPPSVSTRSRAYKRTTRSTASSDDTGADANGDIVTTVKLHAEGDITHDANNEREDRTPQPPTKKVSISRTVRASSSASMPSQKTNTNTSSGTKRASRRTPVDSMTSPGPRTARGKATASNTIAAAAKESVIAAAAAAAAAAAVVSAPTTVKTSNTPKAPRTEKAPTEKLTKIANTVKTENSTKQLKVSKTKKSAKATKRPSPTDEAPATDPGNASGSVSTPVATSPAPKRNKRIPTPIKSGSKAKTTRANSEMNAVQLISESSMERSVVPVDPSLIAPRSSSRIRSASQFPTLSNSSTVKGENYRRESHASTGTKKSTGTATATRTPSPENTQQPSPKSKPQPKPKPTSTLKSSSRVAAPSRAAARGPAGEEPAVTTPTAPTPISPTRTISDSPTKAATSTKATTLKAAANPTKTVKTAKSVKAIVKAKAKVISTRPDPLAAPLASSRRDGGISKKRKRMRVTTTQTIGTSTPVKESSGSSKLPSSANVTPSVRKSLPSPKRVSGDRVGGAQSGNTTPVSTRRQETVNTEAEDAVLISKPSKAKIVSVLRSIPLTVHLKPRVIVKMVEKQPHPAAEIPTIEETEKVAAPAEGDNDGPAPQEDRMVTDDNYNGPSKGGGTRKDILINDASTVLPRSRQLGESNGAGKEADAMECMTNDRDDSREVEIYVGPSSGDHEAQTPTRKRPRLAAVKWAAESDGATTTVGTEARNPPMSTKENGEIEDDPHTPIALTHIPAQVGGENFIALNRRLKPLERNVSEMKRDLQKVVDKLEQRRSEECTACVKTREGITSMMEEFTVDLSRESGVVRTAVYTTRTAVNAVRTDMNEQIETVSTALKKLQETLENLEKKVDQANEERRKEDSSNVVGNGIGENGGGGDGDGTGGDGGGGSGGGGDGAAHGGEGIGDGLETGKGKEDAMRGGNGVVRGNGGCVVNSDTQGTGNKPMVLAMHMDGELEEGHDGSSSLDFFRLNQSFTGRVCNLVARQVTVCLLETPHENHGGMSPEAWAKHTSACLYHMVAGRLAQFTSYAQAYHTLSTSLGYDSVELMWFVTPVIQEAVARARRNYMAWDPPPSNEEWGSEEVLLREVADGYRRAMKAYQVAEGMTELQAGVTVTKAIVEMYSKDGYGGYAASADAARMAVHGDGQPALIVGNNIL